MADFSFTLCLIHHSLMTTVRFIFPQASGWPVFIGVIIIANVIAWAIARHCEMKHKKLAEWISARSGQLKQLIGHRPTTEAIAELDHLDKSLATLGSRAEADRGA